MDWINIDNDKKHVAREKIRAKEVQKTNWWKARIAKGICHYCKREFDPSSLTMDHVVPLSRGGKSTRGNLVPSCKNCNNNKKYYTPVELLLKQIKEEGA